MKGLDIMLKWFKNCRTIEDVKEAYKNLCKKYHPDISGADTTAQMQEINSEYDTAFKMMKDIHRGENGTTYTAKTETKETAEEFRNIINALIHCIGLNIEICGRWVWLTGETYKYKQIIKNLGFRWSRQKVAWYWHTPEDACRYSKHNLSLDDIRERYGSTKFETVKNKEIARA